MQSLLFGQAKVFDVIDIDTKRSELNAQAVNVETRQAGKRADLIRISNSLIFRDIEDLFESDGINLSGSRTLPAEHFDHTFHTDIFDQARAG